MFGSNAVNFNLFSGARLDAGLFLDDTNRFSIDWSGFYMFPNTQSYAIGGDGAGNPVINRPFFSLGNMSQGGLLNSSPGELNGRLLVDFKSQFTGTEFNARYHSYFNERLHTEVLFGLRYLHAPVRTASTFSDSISPLQPDGFLTYQGNAVLPPNSLADRDSFQTINQFIGAQIGGRVSYEQNWFTLSGFGKLALGGTIEETRINGSTSLITPGGAMTTPGGVLALPSNIGDHTRTVFGLVPEFGLNLGIDLCQNVRLNLGYSLLMWSRVVRPGEQLDGNINAGQAPGSPSFGNVVGPMGPLYRFNDEFFYSHNFNIGVEIHY